MPLRISSNLQRSGHSLSLTEQFEAKRWLAWEGVGDVHTLQVNSADGNRRQRRGMKKEVAEGLSKLFISCNLARMILASDRVASVQRPPQLHSLTILLLL